MNKFISKKDLNTKILEVADSYEQSEFHERSNGYGKNYGETFSFSSLKDLRGFDVGIKIDLHACGYSRNLIERVEISADIWIELNMPNTTSSWYSCTVIDYWVGAHEKSYSNLRSASKTLASDIRNIIAKEIIKAWNSNDLLHIREARELRITLANTEQQAQTKGSGKKRL